MLLSDHRKNYLAKISLDKSRVHLTPHNVLLFGGPIDCDEKPSIRSSLYNQLLCKHTDFFENLTIVEHFKDWLNDSIYPDLLTFQVDLAQTASFIIIILESAGSIAEFSAFSITPSIRHKLIIIVSEKHYKSQSFITLGPLRFIQEDNVLAYRFDPEKPDKTTKETIDSLADEIVDFQSKHDGGEQFKMDNHGHIAFLIFELILFFQALTEKELLGQLKTLTVPLEPKKIKSLIFLLTKLDFIEFKKKGGTKFYVALKKDVRVDFGSKDPKHPFNKLEVKMSLNTQLALNQLDGIEKKRLILIKEHYDNH